MLLIRMFFSSPNFHMIIQFVQLQFGPFLKIHYVCVTVCLIMVFVVRSLNEKRMTGD